MLNKIFRRIFAVLIFLVLLTPWLVARDFLFPFITSKAFVFRILIEIAFPFYVYFLFSEPDLRPSRKNLLNWFVLGFLVFSFVSAFFGVNVERSIWGNFERMGGAYYLLHLSLLYFYLLLLGRMQPAWFKRFLIFLTVDGVLLTVVGFLGKVYSAADKLHPGFPHTLSLDPLKWGSAGILFDKIADPSIPARVSATLGNPIFLGSFLIVPLFVAIYFFLSAENKLAKFCYLISFFVLLYGILQTGTRGASVGLFVGFLLSLVLYIIFSQKSKARVWSFFMLGFVGLLLCFGFVFKNNFAEGSFLKRVFSLKDSNSTSRLLQWQVALKGYAEYPILGTGPENYYVIANKYYNPEIYKYDTSWFDKPHNYWLEILTTTGALGFLNYLGIFLLSMYAIFIAYKKTGILSLAEGCVLVGGLFAYQIQNLFVFDTVSTSLVFYVMTALCGFFYDESMNIKIKTKNDRLFSGNFGLAFNLTVFTVSTALAGYGIFTTNVLPAQASKAVNYGFAYAGVPEGGQKSKEYFASAYNNPYNFDLSETLTRYSQLGLNAISGQNGMSKKEASEVLQNAIDMLTDLAKHTENNPILWQQLATLYLNQSYYLNRPLEPQALVAINKARELAPQRMESLTIMSQIALFSGDKKSAVEISQKIVSINPSLDNKWQLAMVYKESGQIAEALEIYEQLLAQKYEFKNLSQLVWVIQYFQSQQKYIEAVKWSEIALGLQPQEIGFYVNLAKLYFQNGDIAKAKTLTEKIITQDPTQVKNLNEILSSQNK